LIYLVSRVLSSTREWIEANVPRYMQEGRMPGFSLAVVKDGETVYAEGFGSRDPQRGLPATPDTLYGIGSITKSFVAIAVMQLVEQGKLSVDDPVSKHVPFKLGLKGNPIRVHHLLTHSLGVPNLGTSTVALYRGIGADTGIPWGSVDDFYRLVNGAQDEVAFPPGERFFYHNAAWRMLGHIVQEKSGMPFHRYIKEKVMSPIGMRRSTLNTDEFNADPDHIVPHWKKPDGRVEPSRFPYPNPEDNPEFSFIAAAGGVASSVNEMAEYLKVQIETGRHKGGRVLSEESFNRIQTLHVRRPEGYYGEHGYGYGLDVTPGFLGHRMLSHGGSILVSTAYLAFIPDMKAGVVMMGNSAKLPYEEVAESIFASMMGLDPSEVVPSIKVKDSMSRLTGTYETYMGVEKVRVVKRGGLLYLEQKDLFTDALVPLIPEDPMMESTVFYTLTDGVKAPIEFVARGDGRIDLFVERYCYHRKQA